ncbi:hypothetical protein [Sulfuriflexus sp.]|uniref:hypothetical protein n=1 Tax=Sulfuriflexus sp. TaxID=2015443 RepID=UPI0028CE3413|nr:hypothetical protein [Sulfuriflexus sp.]MDT8404958.1 hypothetical protein [Sulfuriflexus sp.]
MLSFIYRLVYTFEIEQGMKPNVLYLNAIHFRRLCQDFFDPNDIEAIINRLDMEIVIDNNALHPHMSRVSTSQRQAASF